MNLRQKKSFTTGFINQIKRELDFKERQIKKTKSNLEYKNRHKISICANTGIGYYTREDLNFIVREKRVLEKKLEVLKDYRSCLDIDVEFEGKKFKVHDLIGE